MIFKLIIISIILISIAFAAIAIKMFVIKGGSFKKSCGSVDPATGKRIPCECGGKKEGKCKNEKIDQCVNNRMSE